MNIPKQLAGTLNCAIIPYMNQYLFAIQLSNKSTNSHGIQYSIINKIKGSSLIITNNIIFQKFTLFIEYLERDSRLFRLPNNTIVISSSIYNVQPKYKRSALMGIRFLNYNVISNNYTITELSLLLNNNSNPESNIRKNWNPFWYNNQILFIHTIEPLVIMQLDNMIPQTLKVYNSYTKSYDNLYGQYTSLFSNSSCIDIYNKVFPYRNNLIGINDIFIRGSTLALSVRGEYLSFYHINNRQGPSNTKSLTLLYNTNYQVFLEYFIGAFTFSNSHTNNQSFQLTKVS